MPYLYRKADGTPRSRISFSAQNDFSKCPKYFELKRVQGWEEKTQRASLVFGSAVEDAIQAFHEAGCPKGLAVDAFREAWDIHRHNSLLKYTDKEESWPQLLQIGTEMTGLYEATWRSFGYSAPKFQRSFRKEVCPDWDEILEPKDLEKRTRELREAGIRYNISPPSPSCPSLTTYAITCFSPLAGLENVAYVDMVADYYDEVLGEDDQIIVDIKTKASLLKGGPRMLLLHAQLREYSWMSGIRWVGLLRFVKNKPNTATFKRGDEVVALSDGRSYTVLVYEPWEPKILVTKKSEAPCFAPGEDPKGWVVIAPDGSQMVFGTQKNAKEHASVMREVITKELGEIPEPSVILVTREQYDSLALAGKKDSEVQDSIIAARAYAVTLPAGAITKQRIQFLTYRLPDDKVYETGEKKGRVMAEIKAADAAGYWPELADVDGFPDTCSSCSMNPLCTGDQRRIKEELVQVSGSREVIAPRPMLDEEEPPEEEM
jgi:hypothetical protein